VTQGSAPAPWLAHAKLVVHANSTTGLEAAILGTPCLNVSPAKYDHWVKYSAMRRVNHTVPDAQTAANAIAQFMNAGKGLEPRTTALGFKPDAAARIADACLEVLKERAATPCDATAMSWAPVERDARQIQKFSVTTDEFTAAFQDASRNLRLPPMELIALDDSAVLLRPRATP
jgi:hypothetical protein